MKDFLELTHNSQHGKGSFNDHALVPRSFLTELEMVRCAVGITEAQIGQDNGLTSEVSGKTVKVFVRMVKGEEIPVNEASVGIQHHPEASTNHPATFVAAFLADLTLAASLPDGKQHLNWIAVHDRKKTGIRQKQIQPCFVGCQAPLQPCPVWQAAEQAIIIALQP